MTTCGLEVLDSREVSSGAGSDPAILPSDSPLNDGPPSGFTRAGLRPGLYSLDEVPDPADAAEPCEVALPRADRAAATPATIAGFVTKTVPDSPASPPASGATNPASDPAAVDPAVDPAVPVGDWGRTSDVAEPWSDPASVRDDAARCPVLGRGDLSVNGSMRRPRNGNTTRCEDLLALPDRCT